MSSSFDWPMRLLTGKRHQAMKVIYRFCREVDDIADGDSSKETKLAALAAWEARFKGNALPSSLSETITRYYIPTIYFHELIEGMRMDSLGKTASLTKAELEQYCYLVAGTVGLMAIHIFGCRSEQSQSFAIELGQILQRINILRDIEEDAKRGRCYLPSDVPDAVQWLQQDIEARLNALQLPSGDRWRLLPALAMLGIYLQYYRLLKCGEKVRTISLGKKLRGMGSGAWILMGNRLTY